GCCSGSDCCSDSGCYSGSGSCFPWLISFRNNTDARASVFSISEAKRFYETEIKPKKSKKNGRCAALVCARQE
ncbi:MAG: hypothetical protein MJ085_04805, partial [Clostridia bacterium]|nr:hypothetical protein [Clostridia bacterium]